MRLFSCGTRKDSLTTSSAPFSPSRASCCTRRLSHFFNLSDARILYFPSQEISACHSPPAKYWRKFELYETVSDAVTCCVTLSSIPLVAYNFLRLTDSTVTYPCYKPIAVYQLMFRLPTDFEDDVPPTQRQFRLLVPKENRVHISAGFSREGVMPAQNLHASSILSDALSFRFHCHPC